MNLALAGLAQRELFEPPTSADRLGDAYCEAHDGPARRAHGITLTPPWLVEAMLGRGHRVFIRKVEPKPIRVFLQDGSKDLNIYGGDWWMANQEMERSLRFAGYEVNHVWGEGGHRGLPDARRLWCRQRPLRDCRRAAGPTGTGPGGRASA